MLFKLSTEEIKELKLKYYTAKEALDYLVIESNLSEEAKLKVKYPTVTYSPSVKEGWEEFERCFHKDRESFYQNMLRPKYLKGEKWRRVLGNRK